MTTRVVFMGSPDFAVPSLQALHGAGYDVVAVLTQPDKRAGRGGRMHEPAVKQAARELGLRVEQPRSLRKPEAVDMLRALEPDLFVVAAYGKILPSAVLDLPRHGAINVHASLLPHWRGASPIAASILTGDAVTGVTIMEMNEGMDEGAIISRAELAMPPDARTGTLEPELAVLGADALVAILPDWLAGRITATPQDGDQATYCRPIAKAEGHLRADMTATEAERAIRAYDPWPGAFVRYRGEPLRIWDATVIETATGEPGTVSVHERKPLITFASGALALEQVQKPGRQRIDGRAFVNGERGTLEEKVELA